MGPGLEAILSQHSQAAPEHNMRPQGAAEATSPVRMLKIANQDTPNRTTRISSSTRSLELALIASVPEIC